MKAFRRTVLALLASGFAAAAQAQDIRLYAFSSGALTIGRGILQNLAPVDPPIQIPVGFFVVRHPRGNVLFDTGNNDKLITDPNYWAPDAAGTEAGDDAGRRDRRPAEEDRPLAGRHHATSSRATCTSTTAATSASSRSRPSSCSGSEVTERLLAEGGHRRAVRPRRLRAACATASSG